MKHKSLKPNSISFKALCLGLMLAPVFNHGFASTAERGIYMNEAAPFSVQQTADAWTLIYEDANVRIYATPVVCETANAIRLKVENLTSSNLRFSYKLWNASSFIKTVKIKANQELEGICAAKYCNLLIEAIPAGSDINNMNIQLTYLP